MTEHMPVQAVIEEEHNAGFYSRVRKVRCTICKLETKGHAATVCLFALAKRIEYLEAKLQKVTGEVG